MVLSLVKEKHRDGKVPESLVLPLLQAMGYKSRSMLDALSNEVFFGAMDAPCDILLRSAEGRARHENPMNDAYLPAYLKKALI